MPTDLEYALLGLISLGKHSAFDVQQIFVETPMNQFSSSPGSIYPALARLEKKGWLRSELQREKPTRAKRLYELTREGETVLDEWLDREPSVEEIGKDVRMTFLRFSFLGYRRDAGEILRFLKRLREVLETYAADLEVRVEQFRSLGESHAALTLENGVMAMHTHIRWVDRAFEEVSNRDD